MTLASRIAVMNKGEFIQIGTPNEIYEYPANRFVADFFGTINLFQGKVTVNEDDILLVESEELDTPIKAVATGDLKTGADVWVGVRPEKISITKEKVEGERLTSMKGTVWDIGYYGNLSIYRVKTVSGKLIQVSMQNQTRLAERSIDWDEKVFLSWDLTSSIILNE